MASPKLQTYRKHIEQKINLTQREGFSIIPDEFHPTNLKYPHQFEAGRWALSRGRALLALSFGLMKTSIQLEMMKAVQRRTHGKTLIVCPLGAKHQFIIEDGGRMGLDMRYITCDSEGLAADTPYLITNYERIREGNLTASFIQEHITGCTLDEGDTLRSLGSKTYDVFTDIFAPIPYRFVATATPDPNDYLELINYAVWLGVAERETCLNRYFGRNVDEAGDLQLYPHREKEFWLFVASWALFLTKPSDLGFSDEGFELPPVKVHWHRIDSDHTRAWDITDNRGQARLFMDSAKGVSDAMKEKRHSLEARVQKAVEIIAADDPAKHWLVWHDLEDERKAIMKALPSAVDVYGSQSPDEKERRILDFAHGKTQHLATKPDIAGAGCNFQYHCHDAVFIGIGYKFRDFIQAIHRIARFQQPHECNIHIIHTDAEDGVADTLLRKWQQHDEQVAKMIGIIHRYGLVDEAMHSELRRSLGVDRQEQRGEYFTAVNNDCVDEAMTMADNSIDMICTSIPFCYDDQTEVLTRRGWIGFDQLKVDDDEVATVSPSGQLEYQRPSHVVWEPYEGEMIQFTGQSFNLSVTPNHRMYVARRGSEFGPNKFEIVCADQIATEYENAKRTVENSGRILRGWRVCIVPPARGDGERPERITIPPLPDHIRSGHGVQIYWIETEDFMRLAGWYLSEGHADNFDTGRRGGRLSIAQSPSMNVENYKEIEDLMVRIGLPPSLGANQISVWCRNLAYFMQTEFGHGAQNKRIPRWVLDLHPDLLEIMRDTMMKGDGAKNGTLYASISPALRDAFQEVCLKTGWHATLNGTKIVNTGSHRLFPEIRQIPQRVQYSGMIGCATVSNGTLVVRRNGQPCVSGNSNHYGYVNAYEDFGHNESDEAFFEQMDFLTPELYRVLQPGRVAAIHVKDLLRYGHNSPSGILEVIPFSDMTVAHFRKHGFAYEGRITVTTDVVRENSTTYRLGWTEQCKDGSKMGVGMPEYVLLFRKPPTDRSNAYADVPVVKDKAEYSRMRWQVDAHQFWRSSGDRLLTPEEIGQMRTSDIFRWYKNYSLAHIYDHEGHVALGEPVEANGHLPSGFMLFPPQSESPWVWTDVNFMQSLNAEQARKRLENHVCPLPFDIVERLIRRFTNEDELVLDCFGGLGTTAYVAIKLRRRGYSIELNPDYWRWSVKYLRDMEIKRAAPTLFDLLAEEPQANGYHTGKTV